MIRVSVLYPNKNGNFDMDYYLNRHIPLVHKLLDAYGLVRVEIDKGIGSAGPDTPPPYVAVCHLVFDSLDHMQSGMQAHDPDLAADTPNYTDIKPEFQISEIVA